MIGLLLRFYPAAWRARYGDEFDALLSERPLGPFDVADILLGALDAHLHLRGRVAASQHGRGFVMTLRIGGYAAVLSGFLWLIALAGNAINDGAETGAFWLGIVLLVAVVTTLVALIGLTAFQARRFPALSWAAFAIPTVGGIVALLGAVVITLNGDSDREIVAGLSGWAISTLGLLTLLAGSGLFALAALWTRSLSRRAAALLAFGAITVVPGLAGLSGGLVPSPLAALAVLVTILAFPAGWTAIGVSALRIGRPVGTIPGGAPV